MTSTPILGMLTDTERERLRATESQALGKLDEDGLVELHDRVRRARNKYSKLYRRRASGQVRRDASRAWASKEHARTATKAEVFEDALPVCLVPSPGLRRQAQTNCVPNVSLWPGARSQAPRRPPARPPARPGSRERRGHVALP